MSAPLESLGRRFLHQAQREGEKNPVLATRLTQLGHQYLADAAELRTLGMSDQFAEVTAEDEMGILPGLPRIRSVFATQGEERSLPQIPPHFTEVLSVIIDNGLDLRFQPAVLERTRANARHSFPMLPSAFALLDEYVTSPNKSFPQIAGEHELKHITAYERAMRAWEILVQQHQAFTGTTEEIGRISRGNTMGLQRGGYFPRRTASEGEREVAPPRPHARRKVRQHAAAPLREPVPAEERSEVSLDEHLLVVEPAVLPATEEIVAILPQEIEVQTVLDDAHEAWQQAQKTQQGMLGIFSTGKLIWASSPDAFATYTTSESSLAPVTRTVRELFVGEANAAIFFGDMGKSAQEKLPYCLVRLGENACSLTAHELGSGKVVLSKVGKPLGKSSDIEAMIQQALLQV